MLYRSILRPILFRLPPESAHELALRSLSFALGANWTRNLAARRFHRTPFGELKRFGLSFRNPVGLAAGFDKNGRGARGLAALGFGFVEVGTVTHLAQPGNARPRLFRLPQDKALINRLGFNNDGAATVAAHLKSNRPDCVLGINLGKSRAVSIENAVDDYLASFELVRHLADYIAINVSSPNTPALRELQRADALASLLEAIQQRNRETALKDARGVGRPVPLLVKIAPDLEQHELESIVEVALRAKVDGIIATNTTTGREHLTTPQAEVAACGEGGLSGKPLRARSTEVVATLYRLARGRLTIIGVGGIFNARDAWEKICAGASLVQLYTGFVYEGVGVVREINEGLAELAQSSGFRSLDEAIGCRAEELAAA
ncbi:MAG: dihydroorotate dehydrogenase [Blastocatellia bacterium]|jgi:dihydroorotate dehydrogenase|nr:dihydroorotate dehydrogenase [Blastocatellia bacterium]